MRPPRRAPWPAFLLLACAPLARAQDPVPAPTVDPTALLKRVDQTYAQARTYLDTGSAQTVFRRGNQTEQVAKPFQTAFIRPNDFLFRFEEGGEETDLKLFAVWTTEGPEKATRWWTIQPTLRPSRLGMALAGVTSISGGASTAIPGLLLPSTIKKPPITQLKQAIIEGSEIVEGFNCHRLKGTNTLGEPVWLWIDAGSSLIRRTVVRHDFGEFTADDVTEYRPQIDVQIDPAAFRFVPPADR